MPGTLHLLSHLFPTTTLWGPDNGSQRAITCLLKHTSGNASLSLLVRLIGPTLRNAVWKQFFHLYDLYSDLLTHPLAGDVRKGVKPEMRSRFLYRKKKKPKHHAYIWFCSWFLVLLFTSWVILIKSYQLFNSPSIRTSYSQTRGTIILVKVLFFFFLIITGTISDMLRQRATLYENYTEILLKG